MGNLVHQIIYLRAGNGRNLLQKGNLAYGEGNKVFSCSEGLFDESGAYDVNFYNTYIGNPKPSYVKIAAMDKRETLTDNAYSFYVPMQGEPIFLKWLYIPRDYAKDGRGTFINYGLVGKFDYYPCVYFESPSVDEAATVSGKKYQIKINSKAEDLEYYQHSGGEIPEWLVSLDSEMLEMNGYYSFENIGQWVIDNNYQEKLADSVAFLIKQLRLPLRERSFMIIRDVEENVRKWIAAIEYAFPVDVALKLPFATRLTDSHKKGNLYFVDQNGKYLVTGRNDQKKILALIVGADTRDPATKSIHQLPNSDFIFLEDIHEYTADDYFTLISGFDQPHYDFTHVFLAEAKIAIEELDMVALYDLYKYFRDLSAANLDVKLLYKNVIYASKHNIYNIDNFDFVCKCTKNTLELTQYLTKLETVQLISVVAKMFMYLKFEGEYTQEISDFLNEVYDNVYNIFTVIYRDGEAVTEKSLSALWEMVCSINPSFGENLKHDLFNDTAMKNYNFRYHHTIAGQVRSQSEVEEEATTIITLLRFYFNVLAENPDYMFYANGIKYVINGCYALYITHGGGDIQYDDIIEIVEMFSDEKVTSQGLEIFRNIEHPDSSFISSLYKCTISSRSYENLQDIKFECEGYLSYEPIEQFVSNLLAAKRCPVTEDELFKVLVTYATKFKKIKGDCFIYPAGLKFFEKKIIKSDDSLRLTLLDKIDKSRPGIDPKAKKELYKLIEEKISFDYEKDSVDIKLATKLFDLGEHSYKIDALIMYDLLRSAATLGAKIFPKLTTIYNTKDFGKITPDYFSKLLELLEISKLDYRCHIFLIDMFVTGNNEASAVAYIRKLWKTNCLDNTVLYAVLVRTVMDFTKIAAKKQKVDSYSVIFADTDLGHPSILTYISKFIADTLLSIYKTFSEKEQKYFHRIFNKNDVLLTFFKENILTGKIG